MTQLEEEPTVDDQISLALLRVVSGALSVVIVVLVVGAGLVGFLLGRSF